MYKRQPDSGLSVYSAAAADTAGASAAFGDASACLLYTSVRISCVSVGNPHAVIFTDGADSADVGRLGPLVENAPFFPERTNVEFVRVVNETTLKMRVWERGNGETLACGTGACAAAAVAARLGFVKRSRCV